MAVILEIVVDSFTCWKDGTKFNKTWIDSDDVSDTIKSNSTLHAYLHTCLHSYIHQHDIASFLSITTNDLWRELKTKH